MSCCFDVEKLLIFTGDHEGALIGWNFEGKFPKYFLHDWDNTAPYCKSTNLQDSKSIDCLVVMQKRRLLLSGSADQILRFWDLNDMQSGKPPLYKMHAGHDLGVKFNTPVHNLEEQEEEKDEVDEAGEDNRLGSRQSVEKKSKPYFKRYFLGSEGWSLKNQLTALAVNSENTNIVTTDTSGRIKLLDISRVDFHNDTDPGAKIKVPWFINAHKQLVHTVQIVEQKGEDEEEDDSGSDGGTELDSENIIADEPRVEWPDLFVLTCSKDCNILLHRLSNGVKIGQFGQDAFWNIFDMTQYDPKVVRPNYVREWMKEKKDAWRKMIEERIEIAKKQSLLLPDAAPIDAKTIIKEGRLAEIGLNASMDSAGKLSFGSLDD